MKRKRALSVTDVLNYKPRVMDFDGRWFDSFGKPEMRGCWLVWGNSGNGKTRFALQLSKYLTRFGRVAYDSLEEGLSLSFQHALENTGITEKSGRFLFLDKEPVTDENYLSARFVEQVKDYMNGLVINDETSKAVALLCKTIDSRKRRKRKEISCLIDRLERHKSPDIVIIDSLQYSGLNRDSAKDLTGRFPNKLFIFISHAEGNNPGGKTAKSVRFDAGLKLRVEGYQIPAPVSRFKDGKCKPFVIWEEGSNNYWR